MNYRFFFLLAAPHNNKTFPKTFNKYYPRDVLSSNPSNRIKNNKWFVLLHNNIKGLQQFSEWDWHVKVMPTATYNIKCRVSNCATFVWFLQTYKYRWYFLLLNLILVYGFKITTDINPIWCLVDRACPGDSIKVWHLCVRLTV